MDITRRLSLGCGIAMEQSNLYPGLLKVMTFKANSGAYTNYPFLFTRLPNPHGG
jgi:hypothetical protein